MGVVRTWIRGYRVQHTMTATRRRKQIKPFFFNRNRNIVSMNSYNANQIPALPQSDFNRLLDNTQFKLVVASILTTGTHLPINMKSGLGKYIEQQQCLLAEMGRQQEVFLVRKHYPTLVSPPKSTSPAFKSDMKVVSFQQKFLLFSIS